MFARVVAVIGLAVFLSPAATLAQTSGGSPSWAFVGVWKFNAAKSDVQTTRLTFTQAPSGETTLTFAGFSYAFRIDGKERPAVLGSSAIWTETGPRSWKTVYRMARTDNNIDTFTLSTDGKTLTMTTERFVPKAAVETTTFTRVSGGSGLMGVWQTKSVENVDFEMTLASADAKQVTITWSWGGAAVAPVDGREVSVKGALTAVGPGMTVSFKLASPDAFDLTLKDNGRQISTARYVVTGDRRVMNADVLNGPPGPGQERVKVVLDRQ
jgi:hypothetical protein